MSDQKAISILNVKRRLIHCDLFSLIAILLSLDIVQFLINA